MARMRVASLLLAIAVPSAAWAAQTIPLRTATAARCAVAPSIDGTPDEASWRSAEPLEGFRQAGAPARSATRARALFDDQALYFALWAYESADLSSGGAVPRRTDFAGETVRITLDAENGHRSLVVVEVPYGGQASVHLVGAAPPAGWDTARVRAATVGGQGLWTAEVAVPWSVLSMSVGSRPCIGLDVLRTATGRMGGVSRWSSGTTSADPDPAGTGLLKIGPNPLLVEALEWPDLHLGRNSAQLTMRNVGDAPLHLELATDAATPFVDPEPSKCAVTLVPLERKRVCVPVRCAGPGSGTVQIVARDLQSGHTLYSGRYRYRSDARFHVSGIGWMELVLDHRLAGRTPAGARLRAVDCRPEPLSQPPATAKVSFVGPLGPAERAIASEEWTAEAIEHAVLHRSFRWPTEGLLPGDYAVDVEFTRGAEVLGAARSYVRVSRLEEADLGLASPQRTLVEILDAGPSSAGLARYRGAASLAQRLERAWRAYDTADIAYPDELTAVRNATRAEAAEAERIATDLRRGMRPYRGVPGTHYLAHWSRVDGTPQPYALYVPDTYADTKAAGLVLVLHGYSGGNAPFGYPANDDDPYKVEARKRGWLVLYPWGRGNQDWRDSGETDLLDLLDELRLLYSIDSDRIYLTGVSMGGRGVWHLAARRPDIWAAIVPIAGASTGQVWGVWSEERLACNYLNLPAYIVHGAFDNIVPVEDARTMFRSLKELGYDVAYAEFPTRGHEGFGDWVAELYNWMDTRSRVHWPARVRYDTDWLRWSSAYWVRVDELAEEGRLGSIDAVVAAPNAVRVTTSELVAFTLSLGRHPLIDATAPTTVVVDGQGVYRDYLPVTGDLCFRLDPSGAWRRVAEPARATVTDRPPGKSSDVHGPMRRVFGERFSLVYGTQGWDDESILTSYGMAAFAEARFNWWMWGRVPVVRDTDVSRERAGDSGLLIYGGPEVNAASRLLCSGARWRVPSGVASKIALPNPANPKYLVTQFAGPTAYSLYAIGALGEAEPLPPAALAAQNADFQTGIVDAEGRLIPTSEGSFDANWNWPEPAAPLLLVSDRHWRASYTAGTGWTEYGYDDSDWRPPRVRLRKQFDDTCWHFAAVHKFGRLAHSFEAPVMAIDATPDPERPRLSRQVCYLRRVFDVREPPEGATLRVYLDDEGEVYLNGRLVAALAPEDLVREFDVTEALRAGPNVIAVRLVNTEYDQCAALQLTSRSVAREPLR